MPHSAPLLAQVTQSPLFIAQDSQQLFQESIQHIVGHPDSAKLLASATNAQADSDDDFWPKADSWMVAYRPYVVKDGTLQIPVMGVLLNRFPYQLGRWATGYAYLEKALARGLADDNVKRIAFVCDSPGGEVAGCFELCDKIFGARGQKPIRAFAADAAYSAAYAIACSTDDISVTRSGGVGSIGVVTAHVDYADAIKQMGIKVTFIFAGKHKVDGNPYEKLPDAVKARIQKRIDKLYAVFTSTVARNRAMDEGAVRATEALTYDAEDAISVGLADRLGALDEEMVIFSDGTEAEDEEMATNDNTISKADHDAAVLSATASGKEAGKTEGLKEGASAAKTRITTILGTEDAKKKPIAAMGVAMDSEMTVEQAASFLAKMPEEKAAAAAEPKTTAAEPKKKPTAFEQAMAAETTNLSAGEDGDGDGEGDTAASLSNSILADFAGASGEARKKKAAA